MTHCADSMCGVEKQKVPGTSPNNGEVRVRAGHFGHKTLRHHEIGAEV